MILELNFYILDFKKGDQSMKCSVEFAVKEIILTHYRTFKQPVGKNELEHMVQQAVGDGFSSAEFSSVLQKLKDGNAVREEPTNCFTPKYESVEV